MKQIKRPKSQQQIAAEQAIIQHQAQVQTNITFGILLGLRELVGELAQQSNAVLEKMATENQVQQLAGTLAPKPPKAVWFPGLRKGTVAKRRKAYEDALAAHQASQAAMVENFQRRQADVARHAQRRNGLLQFIENLADMVNPNKQPEPEPQPEPVAADQAPPEGVAVADEAPTPIRPPEAEVQ